MLPLKKEHKQHLSILFSQPVQVLQDFCRLSLDYLNKGPNLKLYSTAAQKLAVTVETIQLGVEGLLYLLVESHRHSVSASEFHDTVLAVGFSEEQVAVLEEFRRSSLDEITSSLKVLAPALPHYHDIEWRFDVQVASRSLHSQITPNLIMKLTLEDKQTTRDGGNKTSSILQTDPNNLKHMIERLDQALHEASSQHIRRVQHTLK